MTGLTDRQAEILAFIALRVPEGRSPTMREIARQFSMTSTNAVNDFVLALVRKGCLTTTDGAPTSRKLGLTPWGWRRSGYRACASCGAMQIPTYDVPVERTTPTR